MDTTKTMDVHQHVFSDFYISVMKNELGIKNCGGAPWPKWSPEAALKMMDQKGIRKAWLSFSLPGIYFKSDSWSRNFARQCNEFLAGITARNPQRFGAFAVLPLPDADGSLSELGYALDTLKLDGIGLLSNVNGIYPGEKSYRPVFAEMDKRAAMVFLHPNNSQNDLSATTQDIFYGWFVETTKAVLTMAKAGYFNDFRRIKFILAHAGGIIPAIMHLLGEYREIIRNANIWVDTAKSVDGHSLSRTGAEIPKDRLLFGSDYPMANSSKQDYWLKRLNEYFSAKPEELEQILSGNITEVLK